MPDFCNREHVPTDVQQGTSNAAAQNDNSLLDLQDMSGNQNLVDQIQSITGILCVCVS